jgi:hypothetical protein
MEAGVTSASFDELVTVATVGLSRRQLPSGGGTPGTGTPGTGTTGTQGTGTAVNGTAAGAAGTGPAAGETGSADEPTGDPADALLEAAARLTVARRAGMLPVTGVTPPPPMPADVLPELPARAGHLLRRATSDPELLADLLTVAAGAGYRAPAPLLPALLDAATRTVALRPAVIAALGSRGRWLATHREDWRRTVESGSVPASRAPADIAALGPAGQPASDDPRAWETGTRAERVAYLAVLRAREPAAARELLAAGWSRETAEERAQLLAVLLRGLSPDDEEFLEAVLDDRASWVRAAARRLLRQLPESAFNQRAARRAAQVLRLRRDAGGHRLEARMPDGTAPAKHAPAGGSAAAAGEGTASLPLTADDLARDGITTSPPGPGIGTAAWLLTQLIAAVPLEEWPRWWGLDAARIASLPVEGGLQVEVHAGWRLAAVSQRNPEWAAALLSGTGPLLAPGRPQDAWPGNHELAALLDSGTRARLAFDVFTRVGLAAKAAKDAKAGNAATAAMAEWAAWPGPWPDALADAVLSAVKPSITTQGKVRTLQGLLAAAARSIPVTGPHDYAAEFAELAQSPACAFPWLSVLRRTADTLSLRRAFHAALAAQPLAAGDPYPPMRNAEAT